MHNYFISEWQEPYREEDGMHPYGISDGLGSVRFMLENIFPLLPSLRIPPRVIRYGVHSEVTSSVRTWLTRGSLNMCRYVDEKSWLRR